LNLAERAAQALDTSGAVRVDLLVTEGQNEYVLEVNTLPGMTETSLLPKIAGAAASVLPSCARRSWERAMLHTGAPQRPATIRSAPAAVSAFALDAESAEEQSVVRNRRAQGEGARSHRVRTA